ncbi:MAG: hypothetical protein R2708_17935 [Vicinamibacterales bacterium]
MASAPARGLCATCRHARAVAARQSTFLLCGRGLDDPGFAKYPVLPVLACAGYERTPAPPGPADEAAGPRAPSGGATG